MSYFYNGPPTWVFSLFSFLGFVLSLIPLPWHLEAWNVGTCMYMLWTAGACLILFVNSIVWSGNVIDWSPTWCDISTHYLNGFNLAIPAASLAINRRLYIIASVRSVTKTRRDQRRAIYIDLAISLGLPLLQIPLQYIVQGHRYNIFEDIGCLGETYETPVAVVLYHLPPLICGLISLVYCVLSIRAFSKSRAQFKELLSANSNLNVNRYLRLMALAATDILLMVPMSIWVLYVSVAVTGLSPWISWQDTHSNFSRVLQVPGLFWRSDAITVAGLETTRAATVAAAFIFFGFFGFADEAVKNYRSAFTTVARRIGYSTAGTSTAVLSSNGATSKGASSRSGPTLPVFIRKETSRKRDSLDSFSSAGLDSLSYIEKEKSFAGTESYVGKDTLGELSLQDVGGLLPDYKETASPVDVDSASSGSSTAGGDDEIEISELHRTSIVRLSIPPPAHARDVPASDIV